MSNAAGKVYRLEQIVSVARPLPVTLTAFAGQATAAGSQLRWTTAQEVNSAWFVVEHSADGSTYQAVATLAAADTSNSSRTYQYANESTTLPTAYYRLRAEGQDGTFAYSSVVVLRRVVTAVVLTTFPNPFEN